MGKFNLNNAADFARATNSFGGSILQQFSGRGASAWILEEGAYKSGVNPDNEIIFHVFRTAQDYNGAVDRISDSGGRRKAKFEFPYMDGQLTEDIGRKAETFDVNIILHGGNYLAAFNRLFEILNEPVPGNLVHPVRGEIRCAYESHEIIHEEKSRKAVAIRLVFIEHNIDAFKLATLPLQNNKSAKSKISKLADAFQKIENTISKVQGVVFLVQSLKNTIKSRLADFNTAYGKLTGNMNATFNPGGNIPGLKPVTQGGLLDADGNVVAASTTIVASPFDPFANLPVSLTTTSLQTALAIEQLAKDVTANRQEIAGIITDLETAGDGQGSHEFFDNIIDFRGIANDLQDAYEAGKQSSQAQVIKYTTPRIMSVREVAFANGLTPDDGIQIAYLNPELDSLNKIAKGTMLRIALS